MRVPFRHVAGHLVWAASGTVWAVWRLDPSAGEGRAQGAYVPAEVRQELLGQVTALIRSLPGEPRVFGVCAQVDPAEVAWKMMDGVDEDDPRSLPWLDHVEAAVELLDGQEMHQRVLWLAVPLDQPGRHSWHGVLDSVWADVAAPLGLRARPVSEEQLGFYREKAEQVEAQMGGALGLRPARPAEIVWLVKHALHRGLEEPLLARAEESGLYGSEVGAGGALRSPSYMELGQVRLAEGGVAAVPAEDEQETARSKRGAGGTPGWLRRGEGSPVARRWLEVEVEAGTGYQAQLVLSQMPRQVAADSADIFTQLEELPFPVDYTIDTKVVTSEKARRQVERKRNDLVDQSTQYTRRPTGAPPAILSAAKDLGEVDARLGAGSEVEVQSVVVLTVWGPTPEICEARARALSASFAGADYRLVRPVGLQEELFRVGLPGTVSSWRTVEFRQHHLSEDWAMLGAFGRTEVGDPTGMLLGLDLDCGTSRPVLVNLSDAPKADASASLGVVGDLGSGKSVMQKLLTASVVDRGERAIVIDRTPMREWAAFGQAVAPGRCQVIDAAEARLSIDPLRIFGRSTAARYATSYLTLQLGVGPMSPTGSAVNRAVKAVAGGPDPSMSKVLGELKRAEASAESPARRNAAAEAADLLGIVSEHPLAAMVFDPTLPALSLRGDMDADLMVITTAGLTLPPKSAYGNAEALAQQPLEALIGRALLYVIAALARETAFADTTRFCSIVTDEVYWLTSSAEGLSLVHEVLHDGRKHLAGLIAGAHDAEELGPDRGLMAYRVLTRTADGERAQRGLKFLGLEPTKERVRLVTTDLAPVGRKDRAGEVLLCAPRQNVGRVKILPPAIERVRERLFTTPGARPKGGSSNRLVKTVLEGARS
ncbi:ATP-binding protein [Streptomyces diastaticus]